MNCLIPWIGGKVRLSSWIIPHFPEHTCYVEPFGGGASVLLNKDPSTVEVYNDVDRDVVQFFETVRDHGDELEEWVTHVPYSRELYTEWKRDYLAGEYPEDPVERAGRYFLIATGSMQGDKTTLNGLKASRVSNRAKTWRNKVDQLEWFTERLRTVVIESMDYADVLAKYDGPETLFYLDPPYVDVGDDYYQHEGEFRQDEFAASLVDVEGYCVVSYGVDVPREITELVEEHGWCEVGKTTRQDTNREEVKERLFCNFDLEAETVSTPGESVALS